MTPSDDLYLYVTEAQVVAEGKVAVDLVSLNFHKYLVDDEGIIDQRHRKDLLDSTGSLAIAGLDNRLMMRRIKVMHEWEPLPQDVAAVIESIKHTARGGVVGIQGAQNAQR